LHPWRTYRSGWAISRRRTGSILPRWGSAHLPGVRGFLIEKEVRFLKEATDNPKRPLTVVLGGAKVSDKIELIKNLIHKADKLVVGCAPWRLVFESARQKIRARQKWKQIKSISRKSFLHLQKRKISNLFCP
jgi:3-phosphoglycerate kinase